ncbi:MAG: SpoIIE family protein phosphatase [Ruminiclostridium sp.]|nr:SpoIIE family protein phosphatase [Ruminiclostridium sp.]
MAAVVIILSTMTAYIGFAEFTAVLEQQYNDSAYEVAETAKTYLNPEKFSQYLDTLEKDEEFELIQQRLDDLTNATDCNFIYVGVVDSNYTSTTYIYDSVNSSLGFDRYPLGYTSKDVDPNYAEDLKHIVETGGRAEKYLYSYGESGAHTSAGLAVKNAEGKVVGIIGVEKTMRVLENARAKYVNHVVTIAAIILVIAVVLYSLYLHRTVISPIKDITNEAERFAEDHQTGSELKAVSSKFEIGVLARSVKKMESDIMQYIDNITKITAEKERISAELNVATQIQADMLPSIFPAFPDRNEFDIYATMNPAKEVGGDFYDFFLIDDDHLAMVMADVSGKGVPAALFMVIAKTIIKNHAQLGELSPAKVLMQANEQLCEGNEAELFVTVWLGILEISTGKGKAANAGHEHPALRRKDGKFELIQYRHSPAVATMDGIRFKEHDFELYPGDTLFVYTDGVAEATDAHNELYGGDRMIDALNKDPNASPKELLATVKKSVDEFVGEAPQFDDITMLGLKYFGAEGNK